MKHDAGIAELPFQLYVIFNDAVVDDCHIPGEVWVSVLLAWPTVSCPSSVSDANRPFEWPFIKCALQLVELASGAYNLNLAVDVDCDACRVVTAVLQASEPLQ
jgi:hypothetical protein